MFYNVLNNGHPDWGMTGKDNEEITRHVMCCNEPKVMSVIGGIGGHDIGEEISSSDESEPAVVAVEESKPVVQYRSISYLRKLSRGLNSSQFGMIAIRAGWAPHTNRQTSFAMKMTEWFAPSRQYALMATP
jgi:hypothetical protein